MDKEMMQCLSKSFDASLIKIKPGQGNQKYISHPLVTQRLNECDPSWHAEVLESYHGQNGALSAIRMALTVGGVTRIEVGGPQRNSGILNDLKNAHSDALKRCAMRFGVALGMWGELEDSDGDEDYGNGASEAPQSPSAQAKNSTSNRALVPQTQRGATQNQSQRADPVEASLTSSKQDPDAPNSVLPTKRREDMLKAIFEHTKGQVTATDLNNATIEEWGHPLTRITVAESRQLYSDVLNKKLDTRVRDDLRRKYQPLTETLMKKLWAVVGKHTPVGVEKDNYLHVQLFEHLGLGSVKDMSTYDVDKMISVYEGQDFLDPAPMAADPPF